MALGSAQTLCHDRLDKDSLDLRIFVNANMSAFLASGGTARNTGQNGRCFSVACTPLNCVGAQCGEECLASYSIDPMRGGLILLVLLSSVLFAADYTTRIELPESGSVILTASEDKNTTQYVLSLKTSVEDIILESHAVPVSAGSSFEWRVLLSCDEDPTMVVALLEANEFSLMLIQYDLVTKRAKKQRVAAAPLLSETRMTQGSLKVNAPNRITLTAPRHEPRSWSVVDGKLIGDDGAVFEQEQTIQFGNQPSEITLPKPVRPTSGAMLDAKTPGSAIPKSPEGKPTPTGPSQKLSLSTLWIVILVLIVVASAVLWLSLKRKK